MKSGRFSEEQTIGLNALIGLDVHKENIAIAKDRKSNRPRRAKTTTDSTYDLTGIGKQTSG